MQRSASKHYYRGRAAPDRFSLLRFSPPFRCLDVPRIPIGPLSLAPTPPYTGVCVCAALHDTANSICCTRSAEYGLLKLEESASQSACATCRRQRTTTLNSKTKKKEKKGPFIPPQPGDAVPGSCISLEIGRKQKWQTESEERKKGERFCRCCSLEYPPEKGCFGHTHTLYRPYVFTVHEQE